MTSIDPAIQDLSALVSRLMDRVRTLELALGYRIVSDDGSEHLTLGGPTTTQQEEPTMTERPGGETE